MNRYLLNLSYIGTKFRGIQKSIVKADPQLDTTTIQGCIEIALQKLYPINPIQVIISSRTDAGVHALQTSVHVDLHRRNEQIYSPTILTSILNKNFHKQNLPIRILNTIHVPETFHCRYNAIARTYLYRIAVNKNGPLDKDRIRQENHISQIPIEDIERCFYIHNGNFDINKVIQATQLFIGRHDFRTFMSTSRRKDIENKPMFTIRKISSFDIRPAKPVINSIEYHTANKLYNYWDIQITGRSFLYKQVRRMVGALIALGNGEITIQELSDMLTIPSKNSWITRINLAPAHGLYLCKVHYNHSDLQLTNQNIDKIDIPPHRSDLRPGETLQLNNC